MVGYGEPPKLLPGYASTAEEESVEGVGLVIRALRLYRCAASHCPGGELGTCADGTPLRAGTQRNLAASWAIVGAKSYLKHAWSTPRGGRGFTACGRCLDGHYTVAKGECAECEGAELGGGRDALVLLVRRLRALCGTLRPSEQTAPSAHSEPELW